ncbi:MAG: class I SAM-dependent methyltransferase [Beijerinckiaceae bacterium]|jgi:SAM-dependent methyltransferase|nr:class I SAM-dependent methyltransferase [Beijerinckiaceae bacterium]
MALDVVDLRSFYTSPLGQVAQRHVGRIVTERWGNTAGLSIVGVGFAPPYLDGLAEGALRLLAFMPAAQGVVNWPAETVSSSALVDTSCLPLPDSSVDRVLIVHALEVSDFPGEMMGEIWRILTPGGKVLVVAPSRGGLWARSDTTPFGHGRPFSRGQLRELMRETNFSPIFWSEALYVPPFSRPSWLRSAAIFERIGGKLALPGAGVHVVEATKQLYRPVLADRRSRRMLPRLSPAAAVPGRSTRSGS